ncbi:MAG TPA: four helix bundle protein [Longimicrobiaceae bacterium]|nr:four helix bundle protein [Longimicrobiaceae bacterium]
MENGRLAADEERRAERANPVRDQSFALALRIVELRRSLMEGQREFVLSKQLLRSGTAVGALVREAEQAESRADFTHKMALALKEVDESAYWLELLHGSGCIDATEFRSVHPQVIDLRRLC